MLKDGRHLPEMTMKSIALHIACFYAFGHLLGLQGHTSCNNRNMVLACLLVPSLPVVLLIRDVYDSVTAMAQAKLHREIPAMEGLGILPIGSSCHASPSSSLWSRASRHLLACNAPDIALAKTRQDSDYR